jgi:hypothetical protein
MSDRCSVQISLPCYVVFNVLRVDWSRFKIVDYPLFGVYSMMLVLSQTRL